MRTETVEYRDGAAICRGIRVWDPARTGARPGILHVPDARGVGLRPAHHVERMVADGYAVFIADLYGEGFFSEDFSILMPRMAQLRSDRAGWRNRACAALRTLADWDLVDRLRLGAMGYCFGGSTVIELGLSGTSLAAIVSFHGGLDGLALEDARHIKASVLLCTGADDPLVPGERVMALQQAFRGGGVADWELLTLGNAKHSFTNRQAPDTEQMGYHALADQRSLEAAASWFQRAFA